MTDTPIEEPRVAIVASAAVCSVGHDATQAFDSIQCGIHRTQRTYLQGLTGPLVAAPVLPITKELVGAERGWALLSPALEACGRELVAEERVGVCLALDDFLWVSMAERLVPMKELAARGRDLERRWRPLRELVATALEGSGHRPKFLHRSLGGHATGFASVRLAHKMLREDRVDAVVVLGVSSQCERATLELLDAFGLSKSARAPQGYIPSEAAGALVVRRAAEGGLRIANPSYVAGIKGLTRLPNPTERASLLAESMQRALERWGGPVASVREVWNDHNGERWRADQADRALLRVLATPGGEHATVHLPASLGDVCAATAIVSLACVDAGRRVGDLCPPVLLSASSFDGSCGAAVVGERG